LAERTAIVRIIEEDGNVMHAVVQTAAGPVTVMANVIREPHRLLLAQIHVEGTGLTGAIIKEAAKELGLKNGVSEVVLYGGMRTSGANPGRTPRTIRVQVES
jgi:hypothetical protein